MQQYDANSVLMGGGGPKGWSFPNPGDTRTGTIAEPPQAKQERDYNPSKPGGGEPKFFPSGDPIMGVHVVIQTSERDASVEDDDGRRTFYIEGRYLKEAVREAVRAAGASGLEVGGQITVTFTHRENPHDTKSRKFWQVRYVPAGNSTLMGQAPQVAPVQQYAPPAQPVQQVQQQAAPVMQAAPAPQVLDPVALASFQNWQAQQQANTQPA